MRERRLVALALISTAAAAAAFAAPRAPLLRRLLEPLELTTLDWRMRSVAAPEPQISPIALVLFDSASVAEWPYLAPFPRAVLAELIDVVSAAGARTIGVDVLLDRRYPALGEGDRQLRDAIRRAGNVVLVSRTGSTSGGRVLLPPDPYFAAAASAVGTADLPTPYETVRDATLTVDTREGLAPGVALVLYAASRGLDLDSLLAAARQERMLRLPGLPDEYQQLPEPGQAQTVPLLFGGPPSRTDRDDGTFPAYPAFALRELGAAVPPEWFRDRVVLLGTGFHAEDRFRSPFYETTDSSGTPRGWTYGTEVIATALANLLTSRYPVPFGSAALLVLLLGLSLAVSAAVFTRGVGAGAAAAMLAFAAVAVAAWHFFATRQLHLPLVEPGLALGFAFAGSTSYVSIVEGREKRQIRRAFSRYLAPEVVSQIVSDPSRLRLGGEKRALTILFSDLVGFTTLAEAADPERLVALLNRYLDEMTRLVFRNEGTLDKYMGDAIMAFYGAPAPQTDHALRACRTALAMQRRLRELNAEWAAEGWPRLEARIGINSGFPIVGNIGGEQRFDYTALGDSVNLAARLEPACKTYGVGIIVSEHTRDAAGDKVRVRELDLISVYGRGTPVQIFELLGLAADEPDVPSGLLREYDRGLAAFRRHDFALARELFQAARRVDPGDRPTRLYLRRCRSHLASPPAPDWDFVERRTHK